MEEPLRTFEAKCKYCKKIFFLTLFIKFSEGTKKLTIFYTCPRCKKRQKVILYKNKAILGPEIDD